MDKNKYILAEAFTDNGEHSHWRLIEVETGKLLWSEFPEEDEILYAGFQAMDTYAMQEAVSFAEWVFNKGYHIYRNGYYKDYSFTERDYYSADALYQIFKSQSHK